MSEKLNLHPWLVSELHSSLQRSNQDSKPLFIGEDSISAPIVAVSVRLHCRRCGAHAYSVPVSTQLVVEVIEVVEFVEFVEFVEVVEVVEFVEVVEVVKVVEVIKVVRHCAWQSKDD